MAEDYEPFQRFLVSTLRNRLGAEGKAEGELRCLLAECLRIKNDPTNNSHTNLGGSLVVDGTRAAFARPVV